jgi:Fe-S-cluster containining protein
MVDTNFPFEFNNEACQSCRGTCCRWGGYVWITEEDMIAMAESRGMELGEFADTYVRAAYGKLSLQDRLIDGEAICCMFDPIDRKCRIYELRPAQCRSFPFWDQYKELYHDLLDYCPGIIVKD